MKPSQNLSKENTQEECSKIQIERLTYTPPMLDSRKGYDNSSILIHAKGKRLLLLGFTKYIMK
jgi:hypothetical protein